ncbi:hypothetical protein D6C77_04036 [Aureobasidium pullulans]|nr:hypothetical protein D6C77_04036 [Aureobasidium pullulans]
MNQLTKIPKGKHGKKRGSKDCPTSTREQLLERFSKEKSFFTAFEKPLKPDPYPPCAVPLKKLKRIYLKDLKSNAHNHGCYVVLRAFGEPVIKPIVINAVEDESGEVDRLAIHDMCEPSRDTGNFFK